MEHCCADVSENPTSVGPLAPDKDYLGTPGVVIENLETNETKAFVYRGVFSDVEDNEQEGVGESEHDLGDESNEKASDKTVEMAEDSCTESFVPLGIAKCFADDVHIMQANNEAVRTAVHGSKDSSVLLGTVQYSVDDVNVMKTNNETVRKYAHGTKDSLVLSEMSKHSADDVIIIKTNTDTAKTGVQDSRATSSPLGMTSTDGTISVVDNGGNERNINMGASCTGGENSAAGNDGNESNISMGASSHISAGSLRGNASTSYENDGSVGRQSLAAEGPGVTHLSGGEHTDVNHDLHSRLLNESVLLRAALEEEDGSPIPDRDLVIHDSDLVQDHVTESGQTSGFGPQDNVQLNLSCVSQAESSIVLADIAASSELTVSGIESSSPVISYSTVPGIESSSPVISYSVGSIHSELDSNSVFSSSVVSIKSEEDNNPVFSYSNISIKSEFDTNHQTSSIHACQSVKQGDRQYAVCSQNGAVCSQNGANSELSPSAAPLSIKSDHRNLLYSDISGEVGGGSLGSNAVSVPDNLSSHTENSKSSTLHTLPDDLNFSTLHIEDIDSGVCVHKSVNYESEYNYVMIDENLPLCSPENTVQPVENKSDKSFDAAWKENYKCRTKSESMPSIRSEDSIHEGTVGISNMSTVRGGNEYPSNRHAYLATHTSPAFPPQTLFSDIPVDYHALTNSVKTCQAGMKPRCSTARYAKFKLPTIDEIVGIGDEACRVEYDSSRAYSGERSNDTRFLPSGVTKQSSSAVDKTGDYEKSICDNSIVKKHVQIISEKDSAFETDSLLLEVESIPAYGGTFEEDVAGLSSDEDREYKLPQCTTDHLTKYRYGTYNFSQEEDLLSKQLANVGIVHAPSDIPEERWDGYTIELSEDAKDLGLVLPLEDRVKVVKTDSSHRIQPQADNVRWYSKPFLREQNIYNNRSRRQGDAKAVENGLSDGFNTTGLCSPDFVNVARQKERKTYLDQELDDDDIDGKRSYRVEEKLTATKYNKKYVQTLQGEDFNLKFLQEHGLEYPIIFIEKSGLGLRVPSGNFKVSDVKACVGSRRMLDVMDVNTQKGMEMTMKDWTKYYENLERDRLLNVISLEFSHTRLENYVESPNLVREIDWVDTAWPQHLKDCQTESTNAIDKMKYPKVQKYCLMSVAGCYTDFHIDFGGTSVWYHILHGEKVFWLIPPTQKNVSVYENWVLSGKQGEMFLGDSIDECQRISLYAGNTFIIPSGWIHAVYTPKDSLVFGGNFLHNFNMVNQLRVSAVEDRTHVPMKFRYPFYTEINWYVLERYVHSLTGITYLEKPQLSEELEVINKMEKEAPDLLEDKLLSKRVAVSLTRIDSSPRSKSTSDDDSTASGPPRSPGQAVAQSRSVRKSSSESCNSTDLKLGSSEKPEKVRVPYKSPVKRKTKYVHLTKFELEGLREIVGWVESLPPNKKGIPKDLLDPETVLSEIKRLIEEHLKDNPELAITGEPVLEWTKATKKLIKLKQKVKTAKLLGTLSAPKVKGKNASGSRHRRVRCKKCEPCTRDDCMECNFCKDMKKYGGPGRAKQSCISRQCLAPNLPNNVSCLICKSDRSLREVSASDTEDSEDFSASLMECGLCWEIVHPQCLQKKYENLSEGVLNEDLPNSWKCAKCCYDGKEGHLKTRVFKGGWRPTPTSSPPPLGEASGYQSPAESIVTEGKRVTSNQAIDSKPAFMEKSFPSPASVSSCLIQSIKAESYSEREPETTVKPTSFTETKIVTIKTESIKTEPVEAEPVEVSGMNGSSDHSRMKVEQKRKVTPKIEEPTKKRRLLSRSPGRSSQHKSPQSSKLSSPRATKGSPGSRSSDRGLRHAADFAMKRSKRESHHPTTSYDFDESELMDTSAPLSDRGKGRGSKGRKVVLKDSNGGLRLASNNAKVVDNADTQHGRELALAGNKSAKSSGEDLKKVLLGHIEKQNLPIIPQKFVARPVTVSPPSENMDTTNGKQHPLPRKLWIKIFGYLSTDDVARCLAVCRVWNRWCINPDLWKSIDLSRKRIVQNHLMGIVRRQPEYLNLSSVIMTQKQVIWLLERIPLLKHLVLSKCSWATVSGLCMSACPLLHTLDTSWASGLNAQCFEDLVTPPVDRKPAVRNISRLHRLKSLNLSGTEITDESLNMITIHMPRLEELNISYCTRISDRGIQMLANSKSASHETLKKLNLSGCRQVTESSLAVIRNFKNLVELNILYCIKIPAAKCNELSMRSLKVFRW